MRRSVIQVASICTAMVALISTSLSQSVALEELTRKNLLPNPTFSPVPNKGEIRNWSEHPDATPLIRPITQDGNRVLEMAPGAASLGITSRPVTVKPGEVYTFAFDLKQENIHIGFGMGTKVVFLWNRDGEGRSPEMTDAIDGSFDWETQTFSVAAPERAKSLQIRLLKKGSPGRVFIRNARLAQGMLAKTREELSVKDFLRVEASYDFIRSRIRDLMADKAALTIPGVEESIEKLENGIAKGIASVRGDLQSRGLAASADEKAKVVWNEMLRGNVGFRVEPNSPYYADWKALEGDREAMAASIEKWIANENRPRLKAAMQTAFGVAPAYAIGVDSTMLKTRRDAPYLGLVQASTSFALARNEEEGVQLTVAALDEPLKDVSVSVGDLVTAEGLRLPADLVSVHRIDYVQTNPPQYYAAGPVGWWPDVVFPAHEVAQIAKGENQAFWVTVATGAETPAGVYEGKVTVSIDGKPAQSVALKVCIWDFALPRPGKFEVIGCFHPYMLKNFYHWDSIREDVVAKWAAFIVKKRWNPTLYFAKSLTPSGEALSAALKEGLNAVNLLDPSKFLDRDESRTYTWPTPEQEKAIREAVVESKQKFIDAGGDVAKTKLYVSGFDEQHDREQYRLMKHVFGLAKEVAPEVRSLTTTTYPPLEGLKGAVDTWVPLLGSDSPDLRERQADGDDVHFYVYAHPFRPYPNPSIIDYHGADARVTFWLAAKKGYTGFLHYLFNGWKANNDLPGPRWPETPWLPYAGESQKYRNGSGYFIYPGPNGQPVSSVRMELTREGIEDWEMITLLKEAVESTRKSAPNSPSLKQAEEALAEAMQIAPESSEYTLDMNRIMTTRNRVAEAILALKN